MYNLGRGLREKYEGRGEKGKLRRERRECDSGMKDGVDRSRGMETRTNEASAKIKPTDPSRLANQTARRNRTDRCHHQCRNIYLFNIDVRAE